MQAKIHQIWRDIDKPAEFASCALQDLLDIEFFFLPPMVYFMQEFHARTQLLFERFTNPRHQHSCSNSEVMVMAAVAVRLW